ncbi:hypothetical protein QFC19_007365 [Naganishia cerealis]|jgi:histone-binding protein RBBP4|uniref:Uncharacterized protein n=1 Tax=Naganishia cerealis TaxID=610337 RepID=A0ACC2VB62_9TREE|nr:hypothetical protein QFC19_007365 [Naganishia cerealis]
MEVEVIDGPEEAHIDQETQDNYRIWKKNAPFLYDYLTTHPLLWPSLSVQFFPDLEKLSVGSQESLDPETVAQRLLVGTFTLGKYTDSISILRLPYYTNLSRHVNIDRLNYHADKQEFEVTSASSKKISTVQKINHLGDVNRARYMPQNPDVIASCNNFGSVLVYDRTKHANVKTALADTDISPPQLRLVSTTSSHADIFAIDWNRQQEGTIASGSMDGQMCVYDIQKMQKDNDEVQPIWSTSSESGINDLEWVPNHDKLFLSASDNGVVQLYDTRQQNALSTFFHSCAVNSVSICPGQTTTFATGDSNGQIDIRDIRMANSIHHITSHTDSITQIKWHPNHRRVLGSASSDKTMRIFDVANDKLLFIHAGHMLGVNDFDWSLHDDWLVATVGDDNSLHAWKPVIESDKLATATS